MKEASWSDCLDIGNSVRITPDREKAKSLIETADERINCCSKISEKNVNFVFEDYYSSMVELIHTLTLLDGFKVSNHVCLGMYLKNVLKRDDLFRIFDDLRFKRNSLTYYGKRMEFGVAELSVGRSKKLIGELHAVLREKNV